MMTRLVGAISGTVLLGLVLAGCSNRADTNTLGGAALGAGAGAIVGGAATHSVGGAVVGGVVGGAAGALIGRASTPGQCVYQDRQGRRFAAAC
jgi:hypothetical protein